MTTRRRKKHRPEEIVAKLTAKLESVVHRGSEREDVPPATIAR